MAEAKTSKEEMSGTDRVVFGQTLRGWGGSEQDALGNQASAKTATTAKKAPDK